MKTKLLLLLLSLLALDCRARAEPLLGDAETALQDLRQDLQSRAARRQSVRDDYLARFEKDCEMVHLDANVDLDREERTVARHVKDLEELGQDVIAGKLKADAVDCRGRGVLHILAGIRTEKAARGLCFNIARALVGQGAPVDGRDDYGWTPLQRTASQMEEYNEQTALRDPLYALLVAHGADEAALAPNGKTAKKMLAESLAYGKHLERPAEEARKRDEPRPRPGAGYGGGPI